MKILSKKWIALVVMGIAFNSTTWAQNIELVVNVSGFNSDKGTAIIYVFNIKKGFPSDGSKAIKIINCTISGGKCTAKVSGITSGEYAISILHDQNSNGKLDTNFFGMPKEGIGVSNNPQSNGPPSYNEAKFSTTQITQLNIKINYL